MDYDVRVKTALLLINDLAFHDANSSAMKLSHSQRKALAEALAGSKLPVTASAVAETVESEAKKLKKMSQL